MRSFTNRYVPIIYLLVIFAGCKQQKDSPLEKALSLAGGNRIELEKVLNRYAAEPGDSLKYKAACFLIENMPGYYYYEGKDLDDWSIYFKCLDNEAKNPRRIIDSLSAVYGKFDLTSLTVKYDIEEIDSTYLCGNIDKAFAAWEEYPWGKNVSFEDFCEYVLPYRIGNEKLTDWRDMYRDLYGELLNDQNTEDPAYAARVLRNRIGDRRKIPRFTTIRPPGYPYSDAFTAIYFNGSCDDINQFCLYAFRALGIPSAIDYMPVRGNENVGHSWVSLKNSNGEFYVLDFFHSYYYVAESAVNRTALKPKVFRTTFSRNTEKLDLLLSKASSVPPRFSFDNYRFFDVTLLYTNYLTNLSVPDSLLYEKKPKNDHVFYLCTPMKQDWTPVDWTVSREGKIEFKEVEAGCLYRVAKYENETLTFMTGPFTIRKQTRGIKTYTTNEKDTPLVLYSKFPLNGENSFRDRMVGGVFEGSDNAGFKNADTLFVIKNRPFRLLHSVKSLSDKPYRYVRYKGPADSHCNVAEVRFFSDSTLLEGKIIGTPGTNPNNEYTNVFDGKTETSFDHNTPSDGWAGLDLGKPQRITGIVYSPRNRDNYIKRGNVYELFISSREGWQSLGRQTAGSDSLRYDNTSGNCLYYIKCHSEGNQERPFTLENGRMIFL